MLRHSARRTALSHALLSLAIGGTPLPAQLATLLKDIQPTIGSYGSRPEFLGVELWASDGTPEGTRLYLEGCPGECSTSWQLLGTTLSHIFLAYGPNPSTVGAIVAIDSSSTVTFRLESSPQIHLGNLVGSRSFAFQDTRLYFSAAADTGVPEERVVRLLATDGSSGAPQVMGSFPFGDPLSLMTSVDVEIYFWRYTGVNSHELWRTTGHSDGATLVTTLDGYPGAGVGVAGSRLIFPHSDESGNELWVSDGSEVGTHPLTGFPESNARLAGLVSAGPYAALFVEDPTFGQEVWRSDGTSAGTFAWTSFGFHRPFGDDPYESPLLVAAESAYFFAYDGFSGTDLWVAGYAGAPQPLKRICQEDCTDRWLAAVGPTVLFSDLGGGSGVALWSTDGTPDGTRPVWDDCTEPCAGELLPIAAGPDRFAFAASHGSLQAEPFLARAPWTEATSLFDPARQAPVIDTSPYSVHEGIFDGERLYFPARAAFADPEPWVSSGAPASTLQLADIGGPAESGSTPAEFSSSGPSLAFVASDENGSAVWLSNGTWDSTRKVPGSYSPCLYNHRLEPAGGRFVHFGCGDQFWAADPSTDSWIPLAAPDGYGVGGAASLGDRAAAFISTDAGFALWRTDGTPAGTGQAFLLPPDYSLSSPLWNVDGRLLFSAGNPPRLYALAGDLGSYAPLPPAEVYPDSGLMPAGEALAFFSTLGEVWRTDGTAAGTGMLPLPAAARLLAATANASGFDLLSSDDTSSLHLWSYQEGGAPILRATIAGQGYWSSGVPMIRVQSRLFVILPGADGALLWSIGDGESTVQNVAPAGVEGFHIEPPELAAIDGHAVFSGCEPAHGCEPWASDGTAEGTRLLHDLRPGPQSSYPAQFGAASDRLYFVADDGIHDREVWTLPLHTSLPCVPGERTLCLLDGRFQVVSAWRDFESATGDALVVPVTPDTGYVWFFDDENVEAILKLIDGGGYNDHQWVFYGALSNVEYTLTVTDSVTGAAKRYFNPAGRFASGGDIYAFGLRGAHFLSNEAEERMREGSSPSISSLAPAIVTVPAGSCTPGATRFCILGDRFAVEATWRDFYGNTGTANAASLTDDTGYLWFFDEANVEVVLKAVDGGGYNGHFWIYFGALSNVEYTITVTDTATGDARVYTNALGNFASFGDIEAFPAP